MIKHRILIISDAWEPQVNGVVRTYQFLVKELEAMGHIVRVIGPHEFPLTLPMPGYPEIRLAIRPRAGLYRMMDEFAPTLVHIATEGPLGWAARGWCMAHKHPFTTAYHTHFPAYVYERFIWAGNRIARFFEKLMRNYLRAFHASAHAILVSTPTLAREIKDHHFVAPAYLMTRGVDMSLFSLNGAKADITQSGPVALYVGRVAIEKNIKDFLDMDWPGEKIVVGDGPLRTIYARDYPDVHFVGWRMGVELAEFYRLADVFVFPSKTDTFGMVLVEALACGVPVAAYPVPGPIDIITAPHLGSLQDNLGAAALAATAYGTPQSRVDHVADTYTWARAAEQFLESYR